MPNWVWPRARTPTVAKSPRARNHAPGTSALAWLPCAPRPRPRRARAMVRHFAKKVRSPAAIMMGAPIQMPISRQARPGPEVAPLVKAAGPTQ